MSDASTDQVLPARTVPTNAVADRLITGGRRTLVLGVVVADAVDDVTGALFEALAHVSAGADGIDLTLPAGLGPVERLAVADQLSEATGAAFYLRTDAPMAGGDHALILPAGSGRLRANASVMYELDRSRVSIGDAWPSADDDKPLVLSTAGFEGLSDAELIGLASAATNRGVAAISTDRVRVVRRAVDSLAPLYPKVSKAGAA